MGAKTFMPWGQSEGARKGKQTKLKGKKKNLVRQENHTVEAK